MTWCIHHSYTVLPETVFDGALFERDIVTLTREAPLRGGTELNLKRPPVLG